MPSKLRRSVSPSRRPIRVRGSLGASHRRRGRVNCDLVGCQKLPRVHRVPDSLRIENPDHVVLWMNPFHRAAAAEVKVRTRDALEPEAGNGFIAGVTGDVPSEDLIVTAQNFD